MQIHWQLKRFDELNPHELYALLQLRSEVFVVEQHCVYLDADGKDPHCYHLLGALEGKLGAYCRILPPGVSYPEASIGRVVSSPSFRGRGLGAKLLQQALDRLGELFGSVPVTIGAQLYLQKFYEGFGFRRTSEVYLEDGIEHIYMRRP
ncbi:GNAT family N-acetyltransferase [Paraflavisolibacter sp. H34]|uniref:GNAT family N-acetyltransferase n=1 Tax=Huijunlia imazamoxiresistens TaxID=3127457 RepID=UPI00301841AA